MQGSPPLSINAKEEEKMTKIAHKHFRGQKAKGSFGEIQFDNGGFAEVDEAVARRVATGAYGAAWFVVPELKKEIKVVTKTVEEPKTEVKAKVVSVNREALKEGIANGTLLEPATKKKVTKKTSKKVPQKKILKKQ